MTITMNEIVIAGSAAEGAGALTGWAGLGPMRWSDIVAALADAGCPDSWAPVRQTAKAHAGQAIRQLDGVGYITRAARRTETDRAIARSTGRQWDARWTIARSSAATARAGESSGTVVLTVELAGEELSFEGDARDLQARITAVYGELRSSEAFQAGDVTDWLSRTLVKELGAVRFGVGFYIPAGSRERANRLVGAVKARWGRQWIHPLLPVATSDELRIGIAAGFEEEVAAVQKELDRERTEAIAARGSKADISAKVAARLLVAVGELAERVVAYRSICGEHARRAADQLIFMAGDLGRLADATSIRGSLLELDAPVTPAAPVVASPAERAADAALEQRRQVAAPARVEIDIKTQQGADRIPMTYEGRTDRWAAVDPQADNSDLERASQLEWD